MKVVEGDTKEGAGGVVMAELASPGSVSLGTGYVEAVEEWVVFYEEGDRVDYRYSNRRKS